MIIAYDEFLDFLVNRMPPAEIIAFQASPQTKERVADLVYRQKTEGLSLDETAELNQFMQIEHLMRLAKARARKRLLTESNVCAVADSATCP